MVWSEERAELVLGCVDGVTGQRRYAEGYELGGLCLFGRVGACDCRQTEEDGDWAVLRMRCEGFEDCCAELTGAEDKDRGL